MMRRLYFIIVLVTVLLAMAVGADRDTTVDCSEDNHCTAQDGIFSSQLDTTQFSFEESYYCNLDTSTCFLREEVAAPLENVSNATEIPAPVNQEAIMALQQQIAQLQQLQQGVSDASSNTDARVSTLESSYSSLLQQLSDLGTTVQVTQSDLDQLKMDLQQDHQQQNSIATGLAGLQDNLQSTDSTVKKIEQGLEQEQSFTKLVKYLFFILLVAAVALGVMYYITKAKAPVKNEVSPQILNYITQNIKAGKKFPQIKASLLKAGWAEDDINQSYKQTMDRNYQQYLQQQNPSRVASDDDDTPSTPKLRHLSNAHKNKFLAIGIMAVIIIGGLLLLLKGVSTGQAIHFKDAGELQAAVKESLDKNVENNEFYPLINSMRLCVQVTDEDNSVSYKIIKNSGGVTIREARAQCDATENNDFAVKFNSFEAFDLASNSLSCSNLAILHQRNNVYILPSQYVQAGFSLNPEEDYSDFCDALKLCMSEEKLAEADIEC